VTYAEVWAGNLSLLSRVVLFRDLHDGFQIRWLDLLTLIHSQSSRLQAITALSLFLQLTVTHGLGFSVFTSRILATDLSQSHCHCSTHVFFSQIKFCLAIVLQLPTQFNTSAPNLISWQSVVPKFDSSLFSLCLSHSQSQSHIATDGQSVLVSSPIWGSWPDTLRPCFCGAPSLTRGRVCLLYMVLALASVVFLRSEPLGTRHRILLSQIWDFSFHSLLRLACWTLIYNHFTQTTQKTASIVKVACLLIRYLAVDILLLRALASAGMCSIRHNINDEMKLMFW
jgi:hypothetical protein